MRFSTGEMQARVMAAMPDMMTKTINSLVERFMCTTVRLNERKTQIYWVFLFCAEVTIVVVVGVDHNLFHHYLGVNHDEFQSVLA